MTSVINFLVLSFSDSEAEFIKTHILTASSTSRTSPVGADAASPPHVLLFFGGVGKIRTFKWYLLFPKSRFFLCLLHSNSALLLGPPLSRRHRQLKMGMNLTEWRHYVRTSVLNWLRRNFLVEILVYYRCIYSVGVVTPLYHILRVLCLYTFILCNKKKKFLKTWSSRSFLNNPDIFKHLSWFPFMLFNLGKKRILLCFDQWFLPV